MKGREGAGRLGRAALVLLAVLCGTAAVFLWACGGVQRPGTFEGPVSDARSVSPPVERTPGAIVVMTWNIAYAHGLGSDGQGYVPHSAGETARRLDRIGELIRDSGADLVLLQEVDFDAQRSHGVDQMEALAHATGLRYGARAVTWEAGHVPFPYWPPGRQFGALYSGGAVLSRFPITANQVTLHPKPESKPWWYNAFYPFRYSQVVQIDWAESRLCAVNNHLEAYDRINREEQAALLAAMLPDAARLADVTFFGGDMNTVPPEAARLHAYPDRPDGDHRGDATMHRLRGIPGFKDVVSPDAYLQNEEAYFTAPAHLPNRRIDYLFVPAITTVKDAKVIRTGELSDHLPVWAELLCPC